LRVQFFSVNVPAEIFAAELEQEHGFLSEFFNFGF
jgi:hypothetical protein